MDRPVLGGFALTRREALCAGTAAGVLATRASGALGPRAQRIDPRDCINTARAMVGRDIVIRLDDGRVERRAAGPILISPGHSKYALMIVRGDVERDGVWAEFYVGSLVPDTSAKPRRIARLFTSALGDYRTVIGLPELVFPGANLPIWSHDNSRLVFVWEDVAHVRQVFSLDARSGALLQLTRSSSHVLDFSCGPTGEILYSALAIQDESESQQLAHNGFAVTNGDAFSLLDGLLDGTSLADRYFDFQRFLISGRSGSSASIIAGGEGRFPSFFARRPKISPDGRWALIDGPVTSPPGAWSNYDDADLQTLLAADRNRSTDPYVGRQIFRWLLVDTASSRATPLWDAPLRPFSRTAEQIAWAPTGSSFVLGPTFTPLSMASPAGQAGLAVAEFSVELGTAAFLPVPKAIANSIFEIRWTGPSTVEVESSSERTPLTFEKQHGDWLRVWPDRTSEAPRSRSERRIEYRQDANTPPRVFALDGVAATCILDLNPGLTSEYALGGAEPFEWRDPDARIWDGRLYLPPAHGAPEPYPLVIQTRGQIPADEFSLYGLGGALPGLGPSLPCYLAQPLASCGIAVLDVNDKSILGAFGTPEEPKINMRAYEAAIHALADRRVVDVRRVGLMGYSRGGWWVEYALTHSSFRYAAAVAADNFDADYFQTVLQGWRDSYVQMNGAQPFGEGLQSWIQNGPAFNADKIHTPLQLHAITSTGGYGSVLFSGWEMLTRLRQLRRPVELFVPPDMASTGTHSLQNPRQCLVIQERTLDWWRFWLQDHVDNAPRKRNQYRSWLNMRSQASAPV